MNLQLAEVTYRGPELTDTATLALLPESYRVLLEQVNGFVAYGGGLHVRGLCAEPDWHSLYTVWHGSQALYRLYPALQPTDIPFGQDAVGDQYLLRDDEVHILLAETGELRAQGVELETFLQRAYTDPLERLGLHPLRQFQIEGHALLPGQLISVYPPFCVAQAAASVSLRAIPAVERLAYLADFAAQIGHLPDGEQVQFLIPPHQNIQAT